MGLVLAGDEGGEDADVAGEALVGGVEQEGGDLRGLLLAVAVDAAVALLDADEAPRDVVVDEVVALLVEVHALGGDIARDEHADG